MSRLALGLGVLVVAAMSTGCATEPARTPATAHDAQRAEPAPAGRTAGWVLVAVGAHAGIVALGTSVMMLHEKSVRDEECSDAKACSSDGIQSNDRLDRLGPWNAGAWILAGAAIGGGVLLLLTTPRRRSSDTTVGITAGPGGAGLKTSF